MINRRRLFLLLVPVVLAVVSLGSSVDEKADFDAAVVQVRKTMDGRRWKEAKGLLLKTLDAHANQDFVRDRLDDIREILKICAVEVAHPRKDAKAVFCGEVASFDAKTGQIVLRWKKPKPSKKTESEPFPCGDFETTPWGSVLRVPFDGSHVIELSGKAIGQETPLIRVCIAGDKAFELSLDAGSRCGIYRVDGEARTHVADTTNSFNVARPYVLKIEVRGKEIEASHNGTRLILGEKAEDECGRVGFRDVLEPDKIEVRGRARAAWIEEQIDLLTKKDREGFQKTYDPNAELPDWLRKP